ncbi:MAG TPA: asparagine synthase (glutamine-hydrolyzing) [Tepidisphaeraceae bacterium]|jgi:asparagine synthase (glutamine-hydrolysing)
MCGFAGIFDLARSTPHESLLDCVTRMASTLRHRGPNDFGSFVDAERGIALGFRRLSIIDLSPEGHQPMTDPTGRYTICFNGEIYNAPRLIRELQQDWSDMPPLRGHSDTEILLRLIARQGISQALQKCIGMFAIALWDRREQSLTLARDRIGEKPLYYGFQNNTLLFGSELKALRAHPSFNASIDRDALATFLRYGYIRAPKSIYENIFKLPPATTITFSRDATRAPEPHPYWCPLQPQISGGPTTSDADAIAQLDTLLRDAVSMQMVADVPLGAFLSGGVDSSTIVALMQAQSTRPVKTFTIGFNEKSHNEAEYARAVANHLKTEHTDFYVTPSQAMNVIPSLPTLYDEPFADSSQIPTFLVSQLAAQHVTVSLSGDGGDELFAGYQWYRTTANIWNKIGAIPRPIKKLSAAALTSMSPSSWDKLLAPLPTNLKGRANGDRLHKLAHIVRSATSPESIYENLIAKWNGDESLVHGTTGCHPFLPANDALSAAPQAIDRLTHLDLLTYLPDNILCKVDRASMGVSLESRAPLLDHRVVELALRTPLNQKLRDETPKWLLKQVLYQYVPQHLIDRPKMGFCVPIAEWLRGGLKDWAQDLIAPHRLEREGYLSSAPVQQKWNEHQSGTRNWEHHLWHVLMFQSWVASQ